MEDTRGEEAEKERGEDGEKTWQWGSSREIGVKHAMNYSNVPVLQTPQRGPRTYAIARMMVTVVPSTDRRIFVSSPSRNTDARKTHAR